MEVTELQACLEGTGATVRQVWSDHGQDPYVLYGRKYKLKTTSFFKLSDIQERFGGKKIVACDCDDWFATPMHFRVNYWVHEDGIVKKEIAR